MGHDVLFSYVMDRSPEGPGCPGSLALDGWRSDAPRAETRLSCTLCTPAEGAKNARVPLKRVSTPLTSRDGQRGWQEGVGEGTRHKEHVSVHEKGNMAIKSTARH